jgi:predicted DCC family thiol-disulfide oxidoreductase YuxK
MPEPWSGPPLIAYDATCGVCRRMMRWLHPQATRHGLRFGALQRRDIARALGLAPGQIPDEFKLLRRGQPTLGGGDAVIAVAARCGWLPVTVFAALPGGRRAICAAYRWFAHQRACTGTVCRRGGR